MDVRSLQSPLKEQYRREPSSSRIILTAKGSETTTPLSCSVDIGRAIYQAEAHKGVGGTGVEVGITEPRGIPAHGCHRARSFSAD